MKNQQATATILKVGSLEATVFAMCQEMLAFVFGSRGNFMIRDATISFDEQPKKANGFDYHEATAQFKAYNIGRSPYGSNESSDSSYSARVCISSADGRKWHPAKLMPSVLECRDESFTVVRSEESGKLRISG